MMDNLRAAANHVVLKVILGLIIVSFVLTGVGNYLIGGSANFAAKVNDQEISLSQFEYAVTNERNRQQQQLGEQFSVLAGNEGYMKQLRQQVLMRMIDESLIEQYTRRLGLGITDEQVKQAIFNEPAFQANGKFDNARYNMMITNMRMTADQYAQALRRQLTTQQLISAVADTDFMLKGETDELMSLISQQRVIREAVIDVNALAQKQQVSEMEIEPAYERNKNQYMRPEQFKVSYIKMDAASMQKPVAEDAIKAYYDSHRDQFSTPASYRYSIIQTKTEAEAKTMLDELTNGADFVTLAKEKSVDIISGRNGGDMGWLDGAAMPEELKSAGPKEKGKLSGVIKSSVGFLIARLDDIKPAQIKTLEEVHDVVADKVKKEQALDAYFALQQKVSDAASNDNESLSSAEGVSGIKIVTTNWFGHNNIPAELRFKEVEEAIFNGNLIGENGAPGSNSDIISVEGDKAFILRIAAHEAESVKPLSDVREQVIALVKKEKAQQQARRDADKLLTALKAGKGEDAMKTAGLSFGEVKTLTRAGKDPVSQAVFQLTLPAKDKPVYSIANDMQGNTVLLAFDEVKAGTIPDDQKAAMVQGITQNHAQVMLEALLGSLRKEAKIKMGDILNQP